MNRIHQAVFVCIALWPNLALAQKISPSPMVNPDHTVTFRLVAPNAKNVSLHREGLLSPLPMHKDENGAWTITAGPWEPDFYGYYYEVDGAPFIDSANPLLKPNLLNPQSVVHIPGPPSLPWERSDIPHGVVQRVFYHSAVVGDDRDYYVYTPPGYDPNAAAAYPVLYLLHGYSDDASGWTAVGHANLILDHLIAEKRAKPMIVVMPLGYGAPEMLEFGFSAFRHEDLRLRNIQKFRDALLNEVIPQVEKNFRVSTNPADRAIAGLSMGGSESLFVGLNAPERFVWIGAFSTGGLPENYGEIFPALTSKASSTLRLLWIACGTEDQLIGVNRQFRSWLKSKEVARTDIETAGNHTWMLWRRNLAAFAPLLFQNAKP